VYGLVLGSALGRLSRLAERTGVCVLFLNQARTRVESAGWRTRWSVDSPAFEAPLRRADRFGCSRQDHALLPGKNQARAAYATGELEWCPDACFVERPKDRRAVHRRRKKPRKIGLFLRFSLYINQSFSYD
jgi:hypothetical protein